MSDTPRLLVDLVIERFQNRCEYCGLSQEGQEATFHVDHVIPRAADGPTTEGNLALACVSCSLRKGVRMTGIDEETGTIAKLFNPRTMLWTEHFRWNGVRVVPLTPVGRTSALVLSLNRPVILSIRREEVERGRHPLG